MDFIVSNSLPRIRWINQAFCIEKDNRSYQSRNLEIRNPDAIQHRGFPPFFEPQKHFKTCYSIHSCTAISTILNSQKSAAQMRNRAHISLGSSLAKEKRILNSNSALSSQCCNCQPTLLSRRTLNTLNSHQKVISIRAWRDGYLTITNESHRSSTWPTIKPVTSE